MIETTILTNLINNEEYIRKVLPYVKDEYFQDHVDRSIYNEIVGYFEKYNKRPPIEAIKISLEDASNLSEDQYSQASTSLSNMGSTPDDNLEWLLDETEKWCSDRAIYNAIMESIKVIDGKSDKSKGAPVSYTHLTQPTIYSV